MSAPHLLVVEGNTAAGRARQLSAGGTVTSERMARQLREMLPGVALDICYPADSASGLPSGEALEGYDGIAITGSSLHIYDGGEEVTRQIELVRAALATTTPLYGSCWGLEIINVAAGGSVRIAPKGREVGFARGIRLTQAGRAHAMYAGKADVFDATAVHLDEVEALAPGTVVLAANAACEVQAAEFRCGRAVAWAVQYHPEYSLAEIAAIVRRAGMRLVDEGYFKDLEDSKRYAEELDALNRDHGLKRIAWRYGIDGAILDRKVRLAEIANWIEHLVLPTRARRGRG
jgi:GMP synthase (glutamine-hydrolysing)